MAGINKVILVGNLGAKPEVKYASNGNAIANLSVATSESWTDKNTGQNKKKQNGTALVYLANLLKSLANI